MKAALWTKLKVAGSLRSLDDEMNYFTLWLPPAIHPLLKKINQWRGLYREARSVSERIEIEQLAIQDLSNYPLNIPDHALVREFLQRIDTLLTMSLKTRQAALEGEAIDESLEEQLINELLNWLASHRHSAQKESAAWLSRMILAWKKERAGF